MWVCGTLPPVNPHSLASICVVLGVACVSHLRHVHCPSQYEAHLTSPAAETDE